MKVTHDEPQFIAVFNSVQYLTISVFAQNLLPWCGTDGEKGEGKREVLMLPINEEVKFE